MNCPMCGEPCVSRMGDHWLCDNLKCGNVFPPEVEASPPFGGYPWKPLPYQSQAMELLACQEQLSQTFHGYLNEAKAAVPQWSRAALDALLERLYECARIAESNGIQEPVFVLPARNRQMREQLYELILNYFASRYGISEFMSTSTPICSGDTVAMIRFQQPRVTLCLMDC